MNEIELGEYYGERYNENLRKALERIQKDLAERSARLTREGLDVTAELAAQQAEIEAYITGELDRAYQDTITGAYADGVKMANDGYLGKATFDPVDAEQFTAIRRNQVVWYETFNQQSSREVFDSMMQWALTGDREDLAPFFLDMDEVKQARYGKTIISNHVQVFAQTAKVTKAKKIGIQRYRYAGPPPLRPFCKSVMNAQGTDGYTLTEINAMDNGQGGMVIATRGGYGCRHRWVPVADSIDEDPDDRSMLEAERDLKAEGVYFGSKPVIWIRNQEGQVINKMNRMVKEDGKGYYYKRFDGTRQGITKKNDEYFFQAKI